MTKQLQATWDKLKGINSLMLWVFVLFVFIIVVK